jgi:hypothetical protein
VLQASLGLFYDRIPLRATSNATKGWNQVCRCATCFGQPGTPVFPQPNRSTIFLAQNQTSRVLIEHRLQLASSQCQVERELPGALSLWWAISPTSASHSFAQRKCSILPASAGIPTWAGPILTGNISRYESSGNRSMTVVPRSKRLKNWSSLRVSYTFRKQ